MVGVERASSIIHAAGVRFGFHHRRQRRARELVANGWAALPRLGGPFELATEVLEIIRADAQAEQLPRSLAGSKPANGSRPVVLHRRAALCGATPPARMRLR